MASKNLTLKRCITKPEMPEPVRTNNVLTLNQKVELLDKFEHGLFIKALAASYGVDVSTVRSIKQNEAQIRRAAGDPTPAKVAKMVRNKVISKLEKQLNMWILEQQDVGISLTCNNILEKAKKLYKIYTVLEGQKEDDQTFLASKEWFEDLKKRYTKRYFKFLSDAIYEKSSNHVILPAGEDEFVDDVSAIENWDVKSLGELLLSVKTLTEFIVSKDQSIKRSRKAIQGIGQALSPYHRMLQVLQKEENCESTL